MWCSSARRACCLGMEQYTLVQSQELDDQSSFPLFNSITIKWCRMTNYRLHMSQWMRKESQGEFCFLLYRWCRRSNSLARRPKVNLNHTSEVASRGRSYHILCEARGINMERCKGIHSTLLCCHCCNIHFVSPKASWHLGSFLGIDHPLTPHGASQAQGLQRSWVEVLLPVTDVPSSF